MAQTHKNKSSILSNGDIVVYCNNFAISETYNKAKIYSELMISATPAIVVNFFVILYLIT
mgnify:CR=1 FL=1